MKKMSSLRNDFFEYLRAFFLARNYVILEPAHPENGVWLFSNTTGDNVTQRRASAVFATAADVLLPSTSKGLRPFTVFKDNSLCVYSSNHSKCTFRVHSHCTPQLQCTRMASLTKRCVHDRCADENSHLANYHRYRKALAWKVQRLLLCSRLASASTTASTHS